MAAETASRHVHATTAMFIRIRPAVPAVGWPPLARGRLPGARRLI